MRGGNTGEPQGEQPRESLTASRQASSIQGERPEHVNSERVPRAAAMGRPYKKRSEVKNPHSFSSRCSLIILSI